MKYKLPVNGQFDRDEYQKHLDILAKAGDEANELIAEILEYVPHLQIIYMYPHTIRSLDAQAQLS